MAEKSDLETKVERLDVKLDALPSSTSSWKASEKLALFGMARDVVAAFFAEREQSPATDENLDQEDPDDDLDLSEDSPDDDTDIDVRVETKDGRVTLSFTVDRENLPVLESFIDIDMLNKVANAIRDKMP